jgi:ornithine decarboxylase
LVSNIIGKKKNNDKFVYYLNDGIYGSFNCVYFDHAKPVIQPYNERDGKLYESVVFGPTCDSIDIIAEQCQLPDLAIGEWVYVENFGAYTSAAASTFNGFQQTRCVYCFV